METIRNHDRYLDPPELVYHAKCELCHETFEVCDMTEVEPDTYVCKDCLSEWKVEE